MMLKNEYELYAIRFRQFIVSIILLVSLIGLVSDFKLFGIAGANTSKYGLIPALLFLFMIVFDSLRQYTYIYLTITKDKIIFRFYPVRPFGSKRKMIEIPVRNFKGYKIRKESFGLKEKLFLEQDLGNRIHEYQGICLTAVSKKNKQKLIEEFERLLKS